MSGYLLSYIINFNFFSLPLLLHCALIIAIWEDTTVRVFQTITFIVAFTVLDAIVMPYIYAHNFNTYICSLLDHYKIVVDRVHVHPKAEQFYRGGRHENAKSWPAIDVYWRLKGKTTWTLVWNYLHPLYSRSKNEGIITISQSVSYRSRLTSI